jgi:hypothetical protein
LELKVTGTELIARIVKTIQKIADEQNIDVYDVTKTDILEEGSISEWQLRSLGGLSKVRSSHYPEPPDKDLIAERGVAQRKSYLSKLERTLGDREYFLEEVGKKIETVLAKYPIKVSNVKAPSFNLPKKEKVREVIAFMSDTHFGITIDPNEVPQNVYNWRVAARRMGKFAEQIATYKVEHRAATQRLRLCLGGDLAQGIIHLTDSNTDLITNQFIGTLNLLVQFIDYLRQSFKEIIVECTTCNHMRLVHKGPDRAFAQKYDSFATMLHAGLQAAYRNVKQVQFHVPKTPFTDFEVLGHRVYMTHGDTCLNIGNPGKQIDIGRITAEVNNLNAAEAVAGRRPYSAVMLGHVHVPFCILLNNGVELVVNGTGSGVDPFAQAIGIHSSHAVQTIFEATEYCVVGDYRKIYLNDATNESRYESVIKPWDYGLELDKAGKI